jgi:hypothetical protein
MFKVPFTKVKKTGLARLLVLLIDGFPQHRPGVRGSHDAGKRSLAEKKRFEQASERVIVILYPYQSARVIGRRRPLMIGTNVQVTMT